MSANQPDDVDEPRERPIGLEQTARRSPDEAVRAEREAVGDQPDVGPLVDTDHQPGGDEAGDDQTGGNQAGEDLARPAVVAPPD